MSELNADGTRLLRYLISRLPTVDPDDMKSYVTYGEAHSALNLPTMGNTTGMSLRRQGLDSLADWAISNSRPAITGLIIDGEALEPGGGFFRAYGKEFAPDRYTWWVDQIRSVRRHDWKEELNESSSSGPDQIQSNLGAGSQSSETKATESLELPGKETIVVSRVVRDSALAAKVKQLHNWECQVCGHAIALPDGSRYAEGHHIIPLGGPHGGLDAISNIICVRPNHHVELDYGAIPITVESLRHVPGHNVDGSSIRYHNEHIWKSKTPERSDQ